MDTTFADFIDMVKSWDNNEDIKEDEIHKFIQSIYQILESKQDLIKNQLVINIKKYMNKTINNIDIEITESVTSEFIISLNSIFHKDLTCKILKNIKKHLTDNNLKKNLLRDIELVDYLEIGNLARFDLNIFEFSNENPKISVLPAFGYQILQYFDIFSSLNISKKKLIKYVSIINSGYNSLPYHNSLHAADVLQSCFIIVSSFIFPLNTALLPIDLAILFISAIIHDYKHPGVTNTYLSNINHKLAVRYI